MTVERLQLMGSDFGMKPSFERMHWIIDHAFVDGDGTLACGASVSDSFLMRAFERTNTRTNPLYWTLQEFIYADGDTMPIRRCRGRREGPSCRVRHAHATAHVYRRGHVPVDV